MYLEIKYLNLLSTRLDKFKQKSTYLWNFRCPICGDSQKNKNKARGFVFEVKGKLSFKCHNCQSSMGFNKFLKTLDNDLWSEYRMETFKEGKRDRRMSPTLELRMNDFQFEVLKPDILANLTPLDKLNNEHPAKEYILNRKLPTEHLYWADEFCNYVNSVKPDTFEEPKEPHEGRIIIPFKDKEGHCFGFQGRAIYPHTIRYITILVEEGPKVFGLNTLDYDETIYITEGPFDSLLLQNACAMGGADLSDCDALLGSDIVFVFDNEPRNRQIISRVEHHIASGDSVVIWPRHIREKDINDMKLAGHNVQELVESNTYSRLTATLKLNEWRK